MTRNIRISAAPHVAFREFGGEGGGVLLHLESTGYFQVNELGATIWQMVEEGIGFAELVRRMRALLAEPPPDLEEDIGRFVDELTSRDLVVIEPID